MDRIYMNRIEGQRRIHVEIHENEVSDLLDDLKADPEHFASTRLFLGILRVAEEIFLPAVSETRRNRDAARQASGQQPDMDAAPWIADGRHGPTPEEATAAFEGTLDSHAIPKASPKFAAGLSDTQPANDEAQPPRVQWRVSLYDPVAQEWAPGAAFHDRDRAVERLRQVQISSPRWADDNTPVKRRLVRETTTWTVEEDESQ
ncbi:hypothetical protein [Streptomyces nymphaeiformis]|uniref:Uncharacterized protein n=1 Tax=Streptomyces nymphaeiformis TaxID=2663842 RepID=A0A7W7XFA7_9ACTN|nr:hypothetical protein [Streptomyces nymphaeiformis]MBB4984978.1 hypothetical protein [Streptomyces nymphaeiformis]